MRTADRGIKLRHEMLERKKYRWSQMFSDKIRFFLKIIKSCLTDATFNKGMVQGVCVGLGGISELGWALSKDPH